jgi:hypothetical protein
MGSGAFGSNGSVHWKIVHTGEEKHNGFIRGRDPNIAYGDPSYDRADAHNSPAAYVVRLRFAGGVEKARQALSMALDKIRAEDSYGVAEVRVPSVERATVPPDDTYEIVILW